MTASAGGAPRDRSGLRVLIAGEEAAGAHILRAVARSQHEVVAVLTRSGAGGVPAPVAGVAERLGVPVLPAADVRKESLAERMRAWGVDVLLNAHSLHIVADAVLQAPRIGAFNLHPGPLPAYAGLNTVAWAIYNGEAEHAVTVHWMAPRVDAGPIALEERFPIGPDDTSLTVSAECTRRGVRLMLRVLELAAADPSQVPVLPQDVCGRTYYSSRDIPAGGRVSWHRPAAEVERLSRAFDYGPFPCPWGRLEADVAGHTLSVGGITRTGAESVVPAGTTSTGEDGRLEVACLDEWVRVGKIFANGSSAEAEALARAPGPGTRADRATPHWIQGAES